ncbi:hypothetical protein [Urbifossiella limnaea]|uniref:Uncharacterized protein n=1 Tax=Urbifossiella limnaea TaxID=2528023 RepID=A0A517XLS9_9BACT|nr:hypothetical protein [Urbifossiella limnaea]QDU18426.1 hypothetical protein ETAA1_03120 [Urbifossiella limnaea]
MSIYATLWAMKLPKAHAFDTEWIEVYAQAVPAHIGHPSCYPEGDPYSDFLPPVVECDPKTGTGPFDRAVVIVAEGRDEKVGQRYTDPLLVMTGAEYSRATFEGLLDAIKQALPWDRDVIGMFTGPGGEERVIRSPARPDDGVGRGDASPTTDSPHG